MRGRHPIARLVAACFRFPPETAACPVSITKTATESGETWIRRFGSHELRSTLRFGRLPGTFLETFGLFTFEVPLVEESGEIQLPVQRGWALGMPIPKLLLPISVSTEAEFDGRFTFDVSLTAPLGVGLIVRYRGWLQPEPTR